MSSSSKGTACSLLEWPYGFHKPEIPFLKCLIWYQATSLPGSYFFLLRYKSSEGGSEGLVTQRNATETLNISCTNISGVLFLIHSLLIIRSLVSQPVPGLNYLQWPSFKKWIWSEETETKQMTCCLAVLNLSEVRLLGGMLGAKSIRMSIFIGKGKEFLSCLVLWHTAGAASPIICYEKNWI